MMTDDTMTNDMMTDRLSCLLEARDWLLADGAVGTNLFCMGLAAGEAPELWNASCPDKVRALYRQWVETGCDLFLTNTFGSNRARLALHGAAHRAGELSRLGARLAREEADKAGRSVVVAGSVGPTGAILQPVGPLSFAEAVEIFHEQAEALKEGGVDVLWVETLSCPQEFKAAARASSLVGMPWCATMSFDTAGRTMMGVRVADLLELVAGLPALPVALGANCGTGVADSVRTVQEFAALGARIPVIAKGNAGIPSYVGGHVHYDGTPELMAEYAVMCRDSGARIIGGCCGSGTAHLGAMRTALQARPPALPPTPEQITAQLGLGSLARRSPLPAARVRKGRRRGEPRMHPPAG